MEDFQQRLPRVLWDDEAVLQLHEPGSLVGLAAMALVLPQQPDQEEEAFTRVLDIGLEEEGGQGYVSSPGPHEVEARQPGREDSQGGRLEEVLDQVLASVLTTLPAETSRPPGGRRRQQQARKGARLLAGGAGGQEEDRVDMTPFMDPVIPGPQPAALELDPEGWSQIDTWGALDCASSCIRSLEDVPQAHRKAWSTAYSTVLRRVLQADSEEALTRGLKWLLALPKLLLREPRRNRGKKSSGEMNSRFEAVREGRWGSLLPFLERDQVAEMRRMEAIRRRGTKKEQPAEVRAKLRKTVLSQISRGQVGKARRTARSSGVASLHDPAVLATMLDKYPPRRQDFPNTVHRGTCMTSLPALKEALLGLKPGVSAGFGGLRNEHIRCLAENLEGRELELLETFGLEDINGQLPPWWYKVSNSQLSVALFKTSAQDPSDLRPVGVKPAPTRFWHREVIIANRGAYREVLEPLQQALSPGGGAKIVHTVRMLLELRPDFVCVPVDLKNAHNEVSRKSVVLAHENEPKLRHLAQHVATYLAPSHLLQSSGEVWGEAEEGECQGDPEAGAGFCTAIHPAVTTLHNTLAAVGGHAIFGNDDGFAIGPAEVVCPAVEAFGVTLLETCNLRLQTSKTKIYHRSGTKPLQAPASMPVAGEEVEGCWLPGFKCYGAYIGSNEYVKFKLGEKVEELIYDIDNIMELLKEDSHAAWSLLSRSLTQQFDYLLSLQYPSDIAQAAARLDNRIWRAVEQLAGQGHVPREEEGLGFECVPEVPGVPSLAGKSFQRWLLAQPVKLGGCGLRSLVETSAPAFIGGVEQALPHMLGQEEDPAVCQQLEDVVGRVEGPTRWREFLAASSRTAQEFQSAWESLAHEAADIWRVLGKEPSGPLAASATSAGGEDVTGITRTLIVKQREELRHLLLTHALENHHDRMARSVMIYQNITDDEVAGSWLLTTPSLDLGMSNQVFQESLSRHLCCPSPAIINGGWEGRRVGKEGLVIGRFGDEVLNCGEVTGDALSHRHDNLKLLLEAEAVLDKVPVDCEVYGLFSDLLPACLLEDGGELQFKRQRQGAIPDFKFLFNTPEGPMSRLAELKCINACKTWYKPGEVGKGAERRAARLEYEYTKKLRDYDVRFHGTRPWERGQPEPVPGPLVARYRGLGGLCQGKLVAGPWGDVSSDLHDLLKIFGESRVQAIGRRRGREGGEGELGLVMGEIRRAVSSQIVRGYSMSLIEKLAHLGKGAREADKRRGLTKKLEEQRRRDRQAFALAHQSRGLGRVGRAFV